MVITKEQWDTMVYAIRKSCEQIETQIEINKELSTTILGLLGRVQKLEIMVGLLAKKTTISHMENLVVDEEGYFSETYEKAYCGSS